jgi:2-succinyl-6-hydroxy-2,4-cyclohexadiene-1-carboxylate synthase
MHPIVPLVFLHGFLGNPKDWDFVIARLKSRAPCFALPLPLNLSEFPKMLDAKGISTCALIGYSMGGRIALQLQKLYSERIDRLALLSSHFGLQKEEEKKKRWEEDLIWIKRLETLSKEAFLKLWQAQPIFCGKRFVRDYDPSYQGALLKTYSLAKQEYLPPPKGTLLLYGEKDLKYAALYHTLNDSMALKDCGHVLHLEDPEGVAYAMESHWQLHRY